jgi:hypothetical protein
VTCRFASAGPDVPWRSSEFFGAALLDNAIARGGVLIVVPRVGGAIVLCFCANTRFCANARRRVSPPLDDRATRPVPSRAVEAPLGGGNLSARRTGFLQALGSKAVHLLLNR